MKKTFLYLYPIEEFTKMFLYDDSLYTELNREKPLPVLNECIEKRYREKGYQVVFVLYPDKEIFGVEKKDEDKVIFTDVTFQEACQTENNKDFIPKYPNEFKIISKLGKIEYLVVGGYHAQDCVRRVAEQAQELGIDTIIDLDLTDFFFNLYIEPSYFKIDEYDPTRYKNFLFQQADEIGDEYIKRNFDKIYSSKAYGFTEERPKVKIRQ